MVSKNLSTFAPAFEKMSVILFTLVPWMSGLVNGLQNRLRRFESARHLTKNPQQTLRIFCYPKALIFGIEDIAHLFDFFIIEPATKLTLSLLYDLGIDTSPHLLKHVQQHGQVVGKSSNGDGIGDDIEGTNHITQSANNDSLIGLAHLVALQGVIKYQCRINQFGTSALSNTRNLRAIFSVNSDCENLFA